MLDFHSPAAYPSSQHALPQQPCNELDPIIQCNLSQFYNSLCITASSMQRLFDFEQVAVSLQGPSSQCHRVIPTNPKVFHLKFYLSASHNNIHNVNAIKMLVHNLNTLLLVHSQIASTMYATKMQLTCGDIMETFSRTEHQHL